MCLHLILCSTLISCARAFITCTLRAPCVFPLASLDQQWKMGSFLCLSFGQFIVAYWGTGSKIAWEWDWAYQEKVRWLVNDVCLEPFRMNLLADVRVHRVSRSRLQLWVRETQFSLVLLLINYCIIFHTTILPYPVPCFFLPEALIVNSQVLVVGGLRFFSFSPPSLLGSLDFVLTLDFLWTFKICPYYAVNKLLSYHNHVFPRFFP